MAHRIVMERPDMRKELEIPVKEKVIRLTSEIVYGQRIEWCSAVYHQMKMSMIAPRQHFPYDPLEEIYPVLVFFCGGGFTEMDRNVWVPELSWYAKHGYAVISVEYSVTARTRFPMQLEDAKAAIRYIRAHAEELHIDSDRIVVMGESAGAYMSGIVALTGNDRTHDVGDNQEYSSAVSGAVCFYCGDGGFEKIDPEIAILPADIEKYPLLSDLIDNDTPPMLLLHGTDDTQVAISHSERMYEALQAHGIRSDLYVFKGAEHADAPFVQTETKEIILNFMNSLWK